LGKENVLIVAMVTPRFLSESHIQFVAPRAQSESILEHRHSESEIEQLSRVRLRPVTSKSENQKMSDIRNILPPIVPGEENTASVRSDLPASTLLELVKSIVARSENN
jgi:hypothetical protein